MRLLIRVFGRPAPQGSKRAGAAPGSMIEQSPYLPAWRAAVKRWAYEAYKQAGIRPGELPLFPAGRAVEIEVCTFHVIRGVQCGAAGSDLPIGEPDIDKLLRATLDPLGGMKRDSARLFADDAQVTAVRSLTKVWAVPGITEPGATIIVSDGRD